MTNIYNILKDSELMNLLPQILLTIIPALLAYVLLQKKHKGEVSKLEAEVEILHQTKSEKEQATAKATVDFWISLVDRITDDCERLSSQLKLSRDLNNEMISKLERLSKENEELNKGMVYLTEQNEILKEEMQKLEKLLNTSNDKQS